MHAGDDQPAQQRHQVLARRLDRDGHAIERPTEGVSLSVADEGRGIPADKLETIFDRFQQVDASDSRAEGRHRPGTRHLPHHRGAARRPHLGGAQCRSRGATFRMFLPAVTRDADLLRLGGASASTW